MSDDNWFFAGKRALVTGGASGIGRAVVLQLVRRGAEVVSVDVADQDDGPSLWLRPVKLDLANARAVDALLDELDGQVELVCNAAGVSPLGQTVGTVVAVDFLAVGGSASDWRRPWAKESRSSMSHPWLVSTKPSMIRPVPCWPRATTPARSRKPPRSSPIPGSHMPWPSGR